jgi:ribosomal protein S12 methylthiotransferase
LPDEAVRLERTQRIRDVADVVGFAQAARQIGREVPVLAEGVDEDGLPVGRSRGQAPEVDGVVYLDRMVTAGTFVTVRIDDALGYDLEGEVIQ